jgi:rare lipoprotein A (peptidoglycan hydrolase)
MVWIAALILAGGIADFDDGERGIASWYQGYYSKGEQTYYAAVGSFRNFHDEPYLVVVTNRANGRSALVWIRDHCTRCYRDGTGKRIIDLSPEVFSILSDGRLGLGLLRVRVVRYERYLDLASDRSGRRAWLLR